MTWISVLTLNGCLSVCLLHCVLQTLFEACKTGEASEAQDSTATFIPHIAMWPGASSSLPVIQLWPVQCSWSSKQSCHVQIGRSSLWSVPVPGVNCKELLGGLLMSSTKCITGTALALQFDRWFTLTLCNCATKSLGFWGYRGMEIGFCRWWLFVLFCLPMYLLSEICVYVLCFAYSLVTCVFRNSSARFVPFALNVIISRRKCQQRFSRSLVSLSEEALKKAGEESFR